MAELEPQAVLTPESSWSLPSAPVFTPSTSNAVIISAELRGPTEQDVSQRMLQLGRSMNIIGPKLISRERYETQTLGGGAKFEVFGHRLPVQPENQEEMLWEGIDVRRLAFKRGKTSLRKPDELKDPSSSWVAVVSESQHSISEIRTDEEKAKQLEQVAAVVREMKALSRPKLRNDPNIVRLFAWGFDNDDFNSNSLMTPILVEERAWGTFCELLRGERISCAERFNLCHDALQGLVAIHQEALYHGDINPKNILVYQGEEGIVAKISDFSHSGSLPIDAGDMLWYQGTKGWQAPEVGETLPASKEDILALEAYSYGLVLWSALGLRGETPLASSPVVDEAFPKFAYHCIESYNIPVEIKNIVVRIIPRLLHHDRKLRFWLSKDMLEDKVEVSVRRIVLQTIAPTDLSMDGSFEQLDAFLRKRARKPKIATDLMLNELDSQPVVNFTNPFLRLMMEEAYVRDIAWRLGSLPQTTHILGYHIPAFKPDPLAYKPPTSRNLKPYEYISLHRLEDIDRERTAGRFTTLAAANLFDIAIGFYSFDASRGLLYMRQAASAGDVRAQALYELLSGREKAVGLPIPSDTLQQWNFDALATGFTLKDHSGSSLSPVARMAESQFRDNSGYNSYFYATDAPIKTAQIFRLDLEPMKEYLSATRFENYLGQMTREGPEGTTVLHYAVLSNNIELVEKIILKHSGRPWGLNSTNYNNETPLLWACRAGNVEITKALLRAGASANSRDGSASPLHWLFAFPSQSMTEICSMIVSGNGRLDAIAPETPMFHFPFFLPEGTPLAWAVATGSFAGVQAVANAIASHPTLTAFEKETCFTGALKIAMVRHEANMMKAMIDAASSYGVSLASVASEGFDWTVVSVPEDSSEIPVAATPLIGDWKDGVIRILRHGTPSNIEMNLRKTLKHVNSLQGSRVSENEVDGNITLSASFMYLKKVIIQSDSESALRLLQRHGPAYTKSDLGEGLFLNIQHNWAVPSSPRFPVFMDIFRGLISAGADVNTQNPSPHGLGNTLMHVIVRRYSDESRSQGIEETRNLVILLLKVLQSCAADINKKNAVGMTVMDYALHNNRNYKLDEELVDMLHRWGSKSTFRLLPMKVEARIGDWGSRELEWRKPERERVDVRTRENNLSILWTEMEERKRAAEEEECEDEQANPASLYEQSDEEDQEDYWDDATSGATACNDDMDGVSVLSQAATVVFQNDG